MTETKKRINALKKRLPGVKARVAATALSLLLAVAMMTSVSFAWFSLSASPALGGVKTIISSNGNLEVALSDYDGLAPDRSGIGDSFSAEGQSVHAANTSWGNLINLSGNYGIENLILRPAKLDTDYPALLTGVKYSSDGRYETTATDFGFTSWGLDEVTNQYNFLVPHGSAFGVRAISSVGYEKGQGKDPLQIALENAKAKNAQAKAMYEALMDKNTEQGKANLAIVTRLVQEFAQSKMPGSNTTTDFGNDLEALYGMLDDFHDALNSYGDALTDLAKIQQKAYCEKNNIAYTPYTRETLLKATDSELAKNGVVLSTFATYKKLETDTAGDLAKIQECMSLRQQGVAITWEEHLGGVVQHLIDINTVTIGGMTLDEIQGKVSGGFSAMMGLLDLLGGDQPVIVKGGNMRTFEQLTGARMNANGEVRVTVSVKYLITLTINGILSTDLKPEDAALYRNDENTTKDRAAVSEFKGAMVAQDTYGMILDLWVRTNAANSYLTLDGILDLEYYYEQLPGKVLINGTMTSVPLWTYTYKTGEVQEAAGQKIEVTKTVTVYVVPQSLDPENPTRAPLEYDIQVKVSDTEYKTVKISEGVFYNYENDEPVYRVENGTTTEALIDHTDVEALLERKDRVLGFQGSNRVDNDYGEGLPVGEISATQGSGSCYIFYADTPEAAAEAKELLKNLKFAFLTADNTIMARAEMDVEHMLEEGGKYIVPLKIVTNSYVVDGVNCIMPLEQNVATRVSILVYLDGTGLENSMVMSKDSILGSLNIQFASAEKKVPMGNMDLEIQTITLSAAISNNRFTYDGTPKSTELQANIGGVKPNTVLAYFQRQVNASQGSRMEPVILKERTNASGKYWGADPQFLTPGTYVLRTLVIDGVEYDLPEPIIVTVEGLQMTYVSFNESIALTAPRYVDRDIELAIQADANTRPGKVQVRFEDENGQYTAGTLTFDPNSISTANPYGLWKGTVRFNSSGTYTLRYVVMDGDYNDVPTTMRRSFTAYMGLRARVALIREGGLTFKYRGPENVGVKLDILSDSGEVMKGLTNVNLYYARRGATSLADSLHAELTWQSTQYIGNMNVDDIGTFVFAQLTVGDNLITVVESAPSITSQPTEPPAFEGSNLFNDNADVSLNANNILVLNDKDALFVKVQTKNATTAYKAVLTLTDAFGATHNVIIEEGVGTDGHSYLEDNIYYFAIPNTMAGNRNGKWTVTGLKLYGVYDASGNYYGETDPENPEMVPYKEYFPLTFSSEVTLIDEFTVNVPTSTVTLGKDANDKVTGSFMQAQTLTNPIQVGIDFAGMTLPAGLSIENPVLTLYHNTNSSAVNGGYSFTTSKYAQIVCPLVWNASLKKYVTADNLTVNLAGSYYGVVTFNLVGATNEAITFTKEFANYKLVDVYSVAPSVEITAAKYAAASGGNVTISDKKAVSVYFQESKNTTCGITTTNYNSPEVDITLSGYGSATGAKLVFSKSGGGDVHLYKTGGSGKSNADQTTAFEWTGNGAVKRYVGKYTYRSSASDEKLAAGTLTATVLEITFSGETYTVATNISINNPS